MLTKLRSALHRLRLRIRQSTPYVIVATLVFLFVVAYLFHRIFITVPAGHAGVHYRWFAGGTDINTVYGEGLHLVWPWNKMTIYNLRIQEVNRDINVLTADGLSVHTTMSIRFRPIRRLVAMLHREHGPDYVDSYLLAELESAARREIGLVKPAELYSSARDSLESVIDKHLRWELRELDEFLTTTWPSPRGFDEWRAGADTLYDTESAEFDSLEEAVVDSLNLRMVMSVLDPTTQQLIWGNGSTTVEHYHAATSKFDSLTDLRTTVESQLDGIESVLVDDLSELETGVRHIEVEPGDSLLLERHDLLTAEKLTLDRELGELESVLTKIVNAYDHYFLHIDIHDVLIEDIVLPPQIAKAIMNKLEQEQVAEEFSFRLIRERREAERKRIEAEGIRDFQETIIKEITPGLLKWKGIEATLELAKSENSKVIIIGSGGDGGLPIILNAGDSARPDIGLATGTVEAP